MGSSCSNTNNYLFIHKMNAEQQLERIITNETTEGNF